MPRLYTSEPEQVHNYRSKMIEFFIKCNPKLGGLYKQLIPFKARFNDQSLRYCLRIAAPGDAAVPSTGSTAGAVSSLQANFSFKSARLRQLRNASASCADVDM